MPQDGHRRKHGIPIQITDCTNDARFALYSTLESEVLRGHTCLRLLVLILLTMLGSERQFICNGNSVNLLRFLTSPFDHGTHRPGNDALQIFPRLGLKTLWLAQPLISLWTGAYTFGTNARLFQAITDTAQIRYALLRCS